MAALFAAELRKLLTTRSWLWLGLAAVALTALYASLSIAFSQVANSPVPPITTLAGQRTLLQVGSAAEPFTAVLGALAVTGELRHGTMVFTLLATPRRSRILVAKMALYAAIGAAYGAICTAVALAVALPWLGTEGIHINLVANAIPATLAGVVAAAALFAVIGVGCGALVGNQVGCVVVLLTYLLVVDPLLLSIPGAWQIYLPGAAADALTQVSEVHTRLLTAWQGGLLLLAYGALLFVGGARALAMRDLE